MKEKFDSLIKSGELFFVGEKLPEDFYHAHNIWREEAQHGNPKADYNLGYCYLHGEGTDIDLKKSFEFYMQAFDKGIKKASKSLVRLKLKLTIGVLNNLKLFDTEPDQDTHTVLERLNTYLPGLYDFSMDLKNRGGEAIDEEINKLADLRKLIHLDTVYKKGDKAAFQHAVDKLIAEGHEWARQISGGLKSQIICLVSNRRTQDVSEGGVHNGTTQYSKSKPYYQYYQRNILQNNSDITLYFIGYISQWPDKVKPGERGTFTSKSGKSDVPYHHDGTVVDSVSLAPFNSTKYFNILNIEDLITRFKLPVKNETESSNAVKSGFSLPAIIFIALMFCVMVFSFIMASK